jgi:flagellar motor switch protein FliN/FliY
MMMMSDGGISQAEIDALLSGVDSSNAVAAPPAAASGFNEASRKTLETFLASTVGAQSSNLSMMTGAAVDMTGPQLNIDGRDDFLAQLPEKVTVIKCDFTSGFPGEHMFLISEECAKSIASLMNKEENIQLDDMAMSVICEVISQMVGHQITSLTDKTGNKSISSSPPEANNVPKAVVAVPAGDFVWGAYQVALGEGKDFTMWEILGPHAALDIAGALSGAASSGGKSGGPSGGGNMGGMQMAMGGMGMGGGKSLHQANVQSVQFPNLMPLHGGPQEAGNIGLIMDVYMEMTVELGRTRKLIKEILAMGEGTIIELDKLAGEPVDILVNHKLIAKGEVVVIDGNFGVRVTEIVSPMERMNDLG